MRRWLAPVVTLAAVISALAVWSTARAMARRNRAIAYQTTVRAYSQALRPGVTRKQVEDYLRSRSVHFAWMYTAFGGRRESQYADLVKIGEESAPWYCSEEYVYVALEFSNESDLLQRIEIFQPDSGCL